MKKILKSVKVCRIMAMSLWPRFLAHPVEVNDSKTPVSHAVYLISVANS